MVLAYSFPLLSAFWTILEIVGFVLWIYLAISVFVDIFRSRDLSGGAKALWVLGVVVFPLVGVLVYLLARGSKMHERRVESARMEEEAFRRYIKSAVGDDGAAHASDRLAQLADLRDRGIISQEQYLEEKTRAMTGVPVEPRRTAKI